MYPRIISSSLRKYMEISFLILLLSVTGTVIMSIIVIMLMIIIVKRAAWSHVALISCYKISLISDFRISAFGPYIA